MAPDRGLSPRRRLAATPGEPARRFELLLGKVLEPHHEVGEDDLRAGQVVGFDLHEDAVTLALCLRDRPSTSEAFATYERPRRRRVEAVVARGKRTGDAKAPGPARDEWLTGHHIDWDSPVPA